MNKTVNNIVSRPRRKADSSVKGKLNRWEGSDYVEFIPTGTKESNRVMKKQIGPSSFYQSVGQKESSYTVHINVDAALQDPIAEAFDIFKTLTKDEIKQKPVLAEGAEGRMLLDDGKGLKIWLDSTTHKVSILAELQCGPNVERQLLQAQSQMNVTLGRYRTDIINNANKE